MERTQLLQETRKVRFEEILRIWTEARLSQEEAARMLGVCSRTFRRYIDRYHDVGIEGLTDKRSRLEDVFVRLVGASRPPPAGGEGEEVP